MSDNVIQLDNYRKEKEAEEVVDLADRVMNIIKDLDIDTEPKMYVTELDGYNDIGLATYNTMFVEPSVSSCCSSLAWISYILAGIGEDQAANDLDNIITRLENKMHQEDDK